MERQKFQTISISYQVDSNDKADAIRNFKLSCKICSMRGLHINCTQCGVLSANTMMIAVFDDLEQLKLAKEQEKTA